MPNPTLMTIASEGMKRAMMMRGRLCTPGSWDFGRRGVGEDLGLCFGI